MGKKKRRGKQRNPNQQQLEGAEPDDSNIEPITETLPEADTPNINNSATDGNVTIPAATDNKDSVIPVSKSEQESNSKEHGKELPNPETEILMVNTCEEQNNTVAPDSIPGLPLEDKSQVTQPTTSTLIGLTVNDVLDASDKTKVKNNSSVEESISLKNVTDDTIASEISHENQTPKEITSSASPDGEGTAASIKILEEVSLEKTITNICEQGTSQNSPPESTIPSNNTYPGKPATVPHEEKHKTTVKTIEEKPEVTKISCEKSIAVLDEYLTEKSSQNLPNIPEKVGPEKSNTEIQGENNHKTDSKQNADCSKFENVIRQEGKVDEEKEDLLSSCKESQKEAKDNLQTEELLPSEKNESLQHSSEQQAVSEGNSNEITISSMGDSRKANKKNKKSNVNKNKAKVNKVIEEGKSPLSSDNCEPSKTEEINQKGKIEGLQKEPEPKIIKQDIEKMEANTTLGENIETPVSKIQPAEENVKPTDGDNATEKDKEIHVIPTSEIQSSSQIIIEEKHSDILNNTSTLVETGSNQIKKESNNSEKMKDCSQVSSSLCEERPDSQTISSTQSKGTEPAPQGHSKEELEKKTRVQSPELGIHKSNTEESNNPSFKGNKEVGKKQPESNDKNKNIAAKKPSQQQKTVTDVSKLNEESETVLDSFADTNLNTMLSRNKKGMPKQKKNDNKKNPTTDKSAVGKPSREDKHEEVKSVEAATKKESETGTFQQTMKTKSIKMKNSTCNTEVPQTENTNPVNKQESNTNLRKEGEGEGLSLLHTEGRVPARPIFMANTCHVCKLTHGGSTRLQTCSACRLITYCSKEHQKKHWKEHKSICHVVQNMVRQRGLTDLFSNAHKITDPDEWRNFRCILLTEAEKYLGRALLPYEREMFLYPRTCGKCHKSDPEKLKVCKLCHYMNFCCNEHIPSNHHIWCQDLKLLLEINQYQSLYGLLKPFIPNFKLNESNPFPKDMKDFILNYVCREKNLNLFNLYEAALSDVASYPLTVLYAVNYLKERNFCMKLSNKLSIHLVGAESQFEADTLSKWDSFLLNLLPDVVQLNLVFIGPELTPNITNQMNCGNYEKKNLKTIDPSKQLVAEFHYGKLYHEYAKEEIFTKPDMICAFNCGIYRFTGFDKQDTWGPTMSHMLKYPNTPIILTAYTAVEAPKDVERFQNQFKIKIIHNTARNPFSSMRPNLNFVSDDEIPVIYKNQYMSIIAKGD